MIIRKAIPQDTPAIVEFQIKMALETENIELDKPTVEKGVHAVFSDLSKGNYYVAEKGGQVVGSLLTTFEWSDWRNGTVLWIQSVFVLAEFRKQGVYKKLYKHVKGLVENDPNLKGIRLYAEKANAVAHKVYEKMGMNADHYQLYEWLND